MKKKTTELIKKAQDMASLSREEAVFLLNLPLCSQDVYAVMAAANTLSRSSFGNKGERHLHIGLNAGPCPYNCRFCSLAKNLGLFTTEIVFPEQQVLQWAIDAQAKGADGLNIMTTGSFSFERLLETGRMLKSHVSTPLVANTRDISVKEGQALVDAGFSGFYHAIRLGEGRDTPFSREKRLETISAIKESGLLWMNCIEPVGPEHSKEEIADLMVLAYENKAVYSGIMRRINFPGSPFERFGMINEMEMARMEAVSRLVMADACRAHCTHEPNSAALLAGGNLFFPEKGSSPRDREAETGTGRGASMAKCAAILDEMGWVVKLPSNVFGSIPVKSTGPVCSSLLGRSIAI
ncbi:MAG: radical SAM protein [Desulfatibacillaceae bacterium]|nr:radical SAM protein [Desulfatibacillaceae bacterium]